MTDQTPYTLPPPRTQEDIDALVDFIKARVKPPRDKAQFGSEEYKALQSLLDIAVYSKGSAQAALERGDDPYMQFHYLTVAARNWDDHPDFQSDWS